MSKKPKQQDNKPGNVIPVEVSNELQSSYLSYALASATRALPNVIDGLIPVSRRILWVLNQHERKLLKSARIVGDVIGKYHPHGDTSTYGTLVNMSGPFKSHPLGIGQGNWGSVDGDSAAAMRYTEVKVSEYALDVYFGEEVNYLLMKDNYDGSLKEPDVLCPKIPTIFIHGSPMATAVGYQTTIPQHNLVEVCDETINYIKKGKLGNYIIGPDYAFKGSTIINTGGIENGRNTGVGKFHILPNMHIEQNKNRVPFLVIDGLSGDWNKADMIEELAFRAGILTNIKKPQITNKISSIKDLSDGDGIRVEVSFKRGSSIEDIRSAIKCVLSVCLNSTNYQMRLMKSTFGVETINGGALPIEVGFKDVIKIWYEYRVKVLQKYFDSKLKELEEKRALMTQMEIFIKNYKKLSLAIIENDYLTSLEIVKPYGINKVGLDYILDSPFRRVQNRGERIKDDITKIDNDICMFKSNKININEYIIKEISDVKKKYGKGRNTKIRKINTSIKEFIESISNNVAIEHGYNII